MAPQQSVCCSVSAMTGPVDAAQRQPPSKSVSQRAASASAERVLACAVAAPGDALRGLPSAQQNVCWHWRQQREETLFRGPPSAQQAQ